jgi:hypothetical protein
MKNDSLHTVWNVSKQNIKHIKQRAANEFCIASITNNNQSEHSIAYLIEFKNRTKTKDIIIVPITGLKCTAMMTLM